MTKDAYARSVSSIKRKLKLGQKRPSGVTLYVDDPSLDFNIQNTIIEYKNGANGPFRSALLFTFNSPAQAGVAKEYFRAAMVGLQAKIPNKEKEKREAHHCTPQFRTAAVRVHSALGAGETALLFFYQGNDLVASHIARTNAREGLGGRLIPLELPHD